jgi:hypothetical protein
LWKTKSSAIEQKTKMEEDQEEDNSSTDTEDVQTALSNGDVPLSKEYTVEHPIDVRSPSMLLLLIAYCLACCMCVISRTSGMLVPFPFPF